MLNWLLSVLVLKDILTEEEASHLSSELAVKTIPSNFYDAHAIVKKVLREYKRNR